MLHEDLFDEQGRVKPQYEAQINAPLSPLNAQRLNMAHYFAIPEDIIDQAVKNKEEIMLLKRLGSLSRELDKIASSMLSSVSVELKPQVVRFKDSFYMFCILYITTKCLIQAQITRHCEKTILRASVVSSVGFGPFNAFSK